MINFHLVLLKILNVNEYIFSNFEVPLFPKVPPLLLIVYRLQEPPSRIVELVKPLYSAMFFNTDKCYKDEMVHYIF